eukprot:s3374_g1.t1
MDQTVQLAYSVDEEDRSKLLGHFPESAPPLPCSPKTAKACHVEEHQFSRVVGPRETTAELYGALRLLLAQKLRTGHFPVLCSLQELRVPRRLGLLPGAVTSASPAMFGMDCSSTCARQEQATSTVKVDVEAMVRRQAEEEARQKAEEEAEQQRAAEARRAAEEAAEAARRAQLEQKLREKRKAEEQERLEAERRAAEEKEQARRRAQEQAEREHEERQREVASFLKQHGFSSINGVKKSFMSSTYPLHKAAELGDAHMVDQLVKAGADVAQKNSGGKTAAQVAAKKDKKGSHSATLSVLTQIPGKGCALAANPLGIDCDSEVAFRKCRMGFHAFLMGTRVGEASHPGPQNDEGSLAQALLQVLQTWQTKAAQRQEAHLHKPPKPEAPPRTSAGKGRGSGPPQSDLVSRLMQVLQAAMQNSWSEDRLVTKMLEKLQPWVSASRDPGEDRQEGQAPNPARSAGSRVQSLSLEPSAPGANKGPEQKKGWGKQGKGKTVESSFVAPTPKSVPKPKSGPHTSKFAAKVDQSEWDAPVVLMSPGQFKQALSDGSAVAGNLILARNDESLQEIQDLCNAFAFTQPLSFAQVTEHDKLLPCVSVWWKKGRDVDQHPQRVKLRITQITPSPGPDVRAPLTVTVKAPKGQPMAVVRIVAPEAYRKLFLKDQAADSPQLIIGEMANWTTCRASELTGGRWQQSQDKTGRVLTGFLRLPESTARALLANSAERQAKPMLFRQGGKSDLGIVDGDPSLFQDASKTKVWQVMDVPHSWSQEDVIEFLSGAGWLSIEAIARKKARTKRSRLSWIVRASPPAGSTGPYFYEDLDQDTFISVVPDAPKKRPQKEVVSIPAPRKVWIEPPEKRPKTSTEPVVSEPVPEVAPTQLDETEPSPTVRTASTRTGRARSRSRGSEHKVSSEAPGPQPEAKSKGSLQDPDSLLMHSLEVSNWSLKDDGGCGDCFFRAAARSIASVQGSEPDQEQIVREAAKLRLMCVSHMKKHQDSFLDFWSRDYATSPQEQDGVVDVEQWTLAEARYWGGDEPPTDFAQYCCTMAKQGCFVDGLCARALAERLGAKGQLSNGKKHVDKYALPKLNNKKGTSFAHRKYVWKCPDCDEERRSTWKNICTLRFTHWKRAHKDVPYNTFLMKPRGIPAVVATKDIPKDQRAWQCPCCDVGLPSLSNRSEMTKAVCAHHWDAHPEISKSKWLSLMASQRFKGVKKGNKLKKAARDRHDKTRKDKLKGHTPVILDAGQENDMPGTKGRPARQWWCCDCLQLVAGYGVSTTRPAEACAKAKKNPGRRIGMVWNKLLKRKHIAPLQRALTPWAKAALRKEGIVPSHQPKEWKRDLCQDGDVEPLPGPSDSTSRQRQLARLSDKVWTLNCGGAKGSWDALELVGSDKPALVMLQETAFTKAEAGHFCSKAKKLGYDAYFSGAVTEGPRPHGGVMLLVSSTLPSQTAWKHVSRSGAAQAVYVGGQLFISTYLAPVPEACDIVHEVANVILSLPSRVQWCLGGDFNELANNNVLLEALSNMGAALHTPGCPTRWTNNRCIDYFFGSVLMQTCEVLDYKVSDHKIVRTVWNHAALHRDCYELEAPPVLPEPAEDTKEHWTKAVDDAWQDCRQDIRPGLGIDDTWENLNDVFFRSLTKAHLAVGTQRDMLPSEAKLRKGKPTHVTVKQRELVLKRAGDVGTITLEASRRNLNDLQTKVHRSPHFDHSLSLTANILHVERELVSCRDFENKRRLDKWRVRVQDDKQAFKWLRKQTGHLSHAVKSSSQDSVAASPQEALVKLKNQWARQPNDVEAAWRSAARSLPEQSRQEARLPALTKEELRKAVLDCKGTAPGIDGWTPREASWFSEDMLQVLTDFCNRCEQEGRVPKIWKVSRQVHLSKGKEPEPDGSLLTSSLRPVSISCLFWRVYTKARFKNTVVQNWIEAVFPSCVYGGIPKKGVQDAAGQLLRCAHAGKYIGSLDLSSVFDLAEPRLAIRIMQHMGLDRRLTSLLQEVWGDQTRFLQFLGETYPQGVAVQHSLPQGDSFSMTAMACVILPAVLDIARQCSDTVQIVYADDRSFACDSARELKRVKTLWQQWAQILGLKENEDKAQYYHLQTKGRRKLVSVGLDPTKIRGSIKVLGYVFSGVLARKADAHETRRLDEARQRASKCACLPGTLKRKIRIAQLTVATSGTLDFVLCMRSVAYCTA